VQSSAVIEGFDVVEDSCAGLSEGREATMIDELVLEAAPEVLAWMLHSPSRLCAWR
jgi:hypothetical protein